MGTDAQQGCVRLFNGSRRNGFFGGGRYGNGCRNCSGIGRSLFRRNRFYGDAKHLAGAQFLVFEPVELHDLLHRYVVAAGDVFNVLVPFHDVLGVGTVTLRDFFLFLRSGLMVGDQQDGIFLQAGLVQGRIGLIKLVYAHAIGLGNAKEGLPLQYHVGEVFSLERVTGVETYSCATAAVLPTSRSEARSVRSRFMTILFL